MKKAEVGSIVEIPACFWAKDFPEYWKEKEYDYGLSLLEDSQILNEVVLFGKILKDGDKMVEVVLFCNGGVDIALVPKKLISFCL